MVKQRKEHNLKLSDYSFSFKKKKNISKKIKMYENETEWKENNVVHQQQTCKTKEKRTRKNIVLYTSFKFKLHLQDSVVCALNSVIFILRELHINKSERKKAGKENHEIHSTTKQNNC